MASHDRPDKGYGGANSERAGNKTRREQHNNRDGGKKSAAAQMAYDKALESRNKKRRGGQRRHAGKDLTSDRTEGRGKDSRYYVARQRVCLTERYSRSENMCGIGSRQGRNGNPCKGTCDASTRRKPPPQ